MSDAQICIASRDFSDARWAEIWTAPPNVRLVLLADDGGLVETLAEWLYPTTTEAMSALLDWDGEGEPTGSLGHPVPPHSGL